MLGCQPERAEVARAVAGRSDADALADALAAAGAPGAVVRTAEEWEAHPQGRELRAAPVVTVERIGDAPPEPLPSGPQRPLSGLRVLDLGRVVAGHTCGRTLAEHGADVVQLSSPELPAIHRALVDTSAGKRSALLDISDGEGRTRLEQLIGQADLFSHSARAGSFERRGLGPDQLAAARPVRGHRLLRAPRPVGGQARLRAAGPGCHGLGRRTRPRRHPDIVSALPCDYVTGYLSALGVMEALARRSSQGGSWRVHTSLCRTAMWLRDQPGRHRPAAEEDIRLHTTRDLRTTVQSGFGRIESLRPAVEMSLTPPRLERPPAPPGTDAPAFAPSC